jgi:hypothetical protein
MCFSDKIYNASDEIERAKEYNDQIRYASTDGASYDCIEQEEITYNWIANFNGALYFILLYLYN